MLKMKLITKYLIAILLCVLSLNGVAQKNLVLNPGFEDTIKCSFPIMNPPIDYTKHWYNPGSGASSHLIHTCLPWSVFNYTYPRTGDAMAGVTVFEPLNVPPPLNDSVWRDYLCGHLAEKLVKGKKYCLELYLYIYVDGTEGSTAAIENFGIYLSKDSIFTNSPYAIVLPYTPYWEHSGSYLSDTSVWMHVEGSFIAQGGEQHFILGNFRTNSNTNYMLYQGFPYPFCYYLVDDVSIRYCGPDTTPEPQEPLEPVIPNVFTPNGDGINDLFTFDNTEGWQLSTVIFNRWGTQVFESSGQHWWDGTHNGKPCSEGVYYYVVKAVSYLGTEKRYNGVVHLLR